MPPLRQPLRRSLPACGIAVLVAVSVAWSSGSVAPSPADAAAAQKLSQLRGKIGSAKSKIERRKGRERVLTVDVQRYSDQIRGLQTKIDGYQARQDRIQSELDRSQATLSQTQGDLRSERRRLVRLKSRLRDARKTLAARLVELYQADKPSLISVVLTSDGFADLLERGEFLRRIGAQDQRVMRNVKDAQREAAAAEDRLSRLEHVQRDATQRIEARREEIVQVKGRLVSSRGTIAAARRQRKTLLGHVKEQRHHLEESLQEMQAQQSKIEAELAGMPAGGPLKRGSGHLVWPANGQLTSSFGYRWGRLHAGIDIAVPVGTPVHAADAGTVAIAGWVSGYGNYVCINHGGGLSTCYGHNSRLLVSVGQQVSQGQVIAASGNTGHSTGPHIHFETRVGGIPRDPMGYL